MRIVTLIVLSLLFTQSLLAQVPAIKSRVFATNLSEPVAIVHAPGDPQHLLVCEVPGRIMVVDAVTGSVNPIPFLDLTASVSVVGDGGLLGLAFDPDYATNGFFYVFYNALPSPADDRVIARYHALPGAATADPASATIIWRYPRSIGHNGGTLAFSPTNGYLYISSGDGGTSFTAPDVPNNAQTIVNNPLGKILRIDPRGDDFPADPTKNFRIPPANPFVGVTGDDEIWAYGVRNPWRCTFDRLTGDFYIADVGLDTWEEINFEPAAFPGGRNYGWKCMEGSDCTNLDAGPACVCNSPALSSPIFQYDHGTGFSITGGYVYRGANIPGLRGRYFFADFVANRIWSLRVSGGVAQDSIEHTAQLHPTAPVTEPISFISSFGEDASGELYLCDYVSGTIYKIECRADFNSLGGTTVQDVFDFLAAWFGGQPSADFNTIGGLSVQDIFDFLAAWFQGCA